MLYLVVKMIFWFVVNILRDGVTLKDETEDCWEFKNK